MVAFLALALTAKNGWVRRSPLVESGTAVDPEHSAGTEDFSALKDKYGVALTDLKPIGKANVEGVVVDVISEGFYIDKGESLIVTRIEDGKVKVDRAEN